MPFAVKEMPGMRVDPPALETVIRDLQSYFGNRVVTSLAVRQQHAHTQSWLENQPPDAVVFPQNGEEVARIVKVCAAQRVPMPRSTVRA